MADNHSDRYLGLYLTACEVTSDESKHLSSNESVIGAEVVLVFDEAMQVDEDGSGQGISAHPGLVCVQSRRGYALGAFGAADSATIRQAHDKGMTCRAFVSAVLYTEEKNGFHAEFAVICYPKGEQAIWEPYCATAAKAFARGDHPDIKLSPKEITRVVQSGGEWFPAGEMERAKLPKGTVYFKKRRSVADSLVNQAVAGNKGCKVAGILFWIVLGLVVIFLVWAYVLH